MRRVLLAVSLLATCTSAVLVGQYRYLPSAPGTWKPWTFNADADPRRVFGARPADIKDLEAWTAVTFGETLELATRVIDQRLARERDTVARLQATYDDIMDPKKREQRIAQYKADAPKVKDPAYLEKMTKAEDTKETIAGTQLLPQITGARAVVTKSEQELAGVKAMASGLSAADKTAPACYAGSGASLSRFRRAPAAGCDPLVRPNWALFNPALPRSAPQLLTVTHFEGCLVADRQVLHVGGCTANKRLPESIDRAALFAWLQ